MRSGGGAGAQVICLVTCLFAVEPVRIVLERCNNIRCYRGAFWYLCILAQVVILVPDACFKLWRRCCDQTLSTEFLSLSTMETPYDRGSRLFTLELRNACSFPRSPPTQFLAVPCPTKPKAVVSTLLFIAGFSLGMGPVGWIYLAEIVPSRIRAKAFSIFTAINWGSNLFIGLFTLTAIDSMGVRLLPGAESDREQQKAGVAGLYAVFAFVCIVCVGFISVFVKETMGKSLEELNSTTSGAKEEAEHALLGAAGVGGEIGWDEGVEQGDGEDNNDGRVAL